jgi:hypothetical protein
MLPLFSYHSVYGNFLNAPSILQARKSAVRLCGFRATSELHWYEMINPHRPASENNGSDFRVHRQQLQPPGLI